ncbi:NUDIX domain-containing protein [Stackebrandtia nassauensis]|uniref:NUDIX hydrolase n=1 Tax=Stackebrandtia nassauensis (strain DSM 44728 / CIP 108903 / NRRL B-16338 / NBRC 102104 / LLR-40K-21) TaxID=446470 RepID=D3Q8P4_STANL|nr:NUDIX domain-containing protein [Stackebrandtia nassauensis]ADD44486.1 NUDIX hydrolase [Stackebrandtia nassauensis DSM 44728]
MLKTTRVSAYGILTDDRGRVLMQRTRANSDVPDSWWLPGGGLDHGEDPADAVVREMREETGLDVEVTALRTVETQLVELGPDWRYHKVSVVYDVKDVGGRLKTEVGELSDDADNVWCDLADLDGKRMIELNAEVLGVRAVPMVRTRPPTRPSPVPDGQVQRVGVYAWVTDPLGRVLMTLIPEGFPMAGLWHLPGGGLDFGERPREALSREIVEETSQDAVLGGLRCVQSIHHAESIGPSGRVEDFHGIHVIYDATVAEPKPLEIQDVGGSTSEVVWLEVDEIRRLPVTPAVEAALALA